ncbi:uncharacterized protein TNCV_1243251 [Trichonephila clavipes]|nr:uncharacterized protein TNCV_1243251 [Trichonephila clavipes]
MNATGTGFKSRARKINSAIHPFSGSIKEYQACLGTKHWGLLRQTDHLTGTSLMHLSVQGHNNWEWQVPLRHEGTVNSRRAANLLMRLVKGEEKWEISGHHQGFLSLNWGGTGQNRAITCMVLKADDRRKNLALSCDEFRGPRFDFVRQFAYNSSNLAFLTNQNKSYRLSKNKQKTKQPMDFAFASDSSHVVVYLASGGRI